ncbi:MAG: response regulator transcription factor [Rhodocyclaceae bacterium]|jgi:DNA-binding NarL/FixJ family response regulator|nr:response regulator transcription factor [Rhodocyclaceae bacterium]
MIRIVIADDHAIVRQGLRQLLAITPDLELAGEAKDGWEVLERVRSGGFDLLLTDLSMPGPNGVDLVKRVHDEAPRLPVLVLSMHDEAQIATRAIKAGARGYLTKDSEPETLLAAIRKVSSGGHYIDSELASRLVFGQEAASDGEVPHACLSDREYQVFLQLARGESINDIAAALHLSAKTVSTHKFRLMQKMQFESLSDLVRYALRHALIEE